MILILTYGKVMSTSIKDFFNKHFADETYYSHAFHSTTYQLFEELFSSNDIKEEEIQNLKNSIFTIDEKNKIKEHIENQKEIFIISGVRDPIDRAISLISQNLNGLFFDETDKNDSETIFRLKRDFEKYWISSDKKNIKRNFISEIIRADIWWFKKEIEENFGINILETPFDNDQGYSIYKSKNKNITLIFFKHENGSETLELGLSKIFPEIDIKLPHANSSNEKITSLVYNALKNELSLSDGILNEIYLSPVIRHFYSEKEILKNKNKWIKERTTLPVKPKPTVSACILITLHNHANWIKNQLTSIIDQWRDDLELLLIDDGSTDRGLEAALELLAKNKEINSTVIRFESSQGLGLVNQIVKYTSAPIIIQCDSDDYCLPGRINKILDCFQSDPNCRLVTSNAVLISEDNIPLALYDSNYKDTILTDSTLLVDQWNAPYYLGASSAFHRSIIEDFPAFDENLCPYGFDLITPLRALLLGSHHYIAIPLVAWRQHQKNTHKLAGAGKSNLNQKEHYLSLELRCLAQRIRDIEYLLKKQRPQNNITILKTLENCNKHFQRSFDNWSVTRKKLDDGMSVDSEKDKKFAVPPLLTLRKNSFHKYNFDAALSQISAQWSGYYNPESNWIWTSYLSMITFLIPDLTVKELRLTFSTIDLEEERKISFYVNFELIKEISIKSGETTTVSLPIKKRNNYNTTILLTQVHNAASPKSLDITMLDERVLGLCLICLEVV